jgi:hypothetical protein
MEHIPAGHFIRVVTVDTTITGIWPGSAAGYRRRLAAGLLDLSGGRFEISDRHNTLTLVVVDQVAGGSSVDCRPGSVVTIGFDQVLQVFHLGRSVWCRESVHQADHCLDSAD